MKEEKEVKEPDNQLAVRQAASTDEMIGRDPTVTGLAQMFGGDLLREVTTFVGNSAQIWAFTAKCNGDEVQRGSTKCNIPFVLNEFYCHEVDMRPDDGGEVARGIRSVLCMDDGTLLSFVSDGIARDLMRLKGMFTIEELHKGIKIKIVEIPCKPPYRTFRIVPA